MRKAIKPILWGFGVISLSFGFQNCSDVEFKTKSSLCAEGEVCTNSLPGGKCFEQTYTQPSTVTENQALDILMVTDTSGSLAEERRQVAEGMSLLLQQLPEAANINMSVMLAHGDRSSYGGKLFAKRSSDIVFRAQNKTKQQVSNYILENLASSLPADNDTDGGEVLLYSLYSSLFNNYLSIQSQGFYRQDTNLVVIMITDENDICSLGTYPRPERATPVYDPEQREDDAYQNYCVDSAGRAIVTPMAIKNGFADIKSNSQVYVHSISYLDPDLVPNNGENEIGYGVIDLVDLMGGVKVDMGKATNDKDHIPRELAKIGELTQKQLGYLKTQFDLKAANNVDPQSVRVFVDGQPNYNYEFNSSLQAVKLSSAGTAGSVIELEYCSLD